MDDIFKPALFEMFSNKSQIYGPESFQDYITRNGFSKVRTATYISIDSFERLPRSLRENSIMVLRLGASEGTGTQFALIHSPNLLEDFFIVEEVHLKNSSGNTFLPHASVVNFSLIVPRYFSLKVLSFHQS